MFRDKLLPPWMLNWLKTSGVSYFEIFNQVEQRLWFYYFLRIKKQIAWSLFGISAICYFFGHKILGGPEGGEVYPSVMVILLILMTSSLIYGIKLHQQKPLPAQAWEEFTSDLNRLLETVYGPEWLSLLQDLQPTVFDLGILEEEVDLKLLSLAENVCRPETPLNGPEAVFFLQIRDLANKFCLVTQGHELTRIAGRLASCASVG